MKKNSTLFLLSACFFVFPFFPAGAADENGNGKVMTSDGQNAYIVSEQREISDDIPDDLYAVGGSLDVTGRIGGDLGAAAAKLEVTAPVADDIRLAGQFVTVSSPQVGGNALVAGQDILFRSLSQVNGDVWAFGANVELGGTVGGNVKIFAEKVIINGRISGDAEIEANSVSFGENGFINGNLALKASANVPEDKVGGAVAFTEWNTKKSGGTLTDSPWVFWTPFAFMMLISKLLIGLLLLAAFRNFGVFFVETVKRNLFLSMGIAFLTLIIVPFLFIFLLITIVGIPLAFLLLFAYLALLIFACIISGLTIGAFLFPMNRKDSFWYLYGAFAAGTLLFFLIGIIPYFGAVIQFLIFLVALGGLLNVKYEVLTVLKKAKKI